MHSTDKSITPRAWPRIVAVLEFASGIIGAAVVGGVIGLAFIAHVAHISIP